MIGGIGSFRQAKQRLIELVRYTKMKYSYDTSRGYQGVGDSLAAALDIEIKERENAFNFGGYLPAAPPTRSKPIITLDSADTDPDHRSFTYYHEISHHLIRSDDDLYSFLSDIASKNEDFDLLVDRFADIGSAEFLIPSENMSSIIREQGFSIKLLPDLADFFPASKPAIAIQMAQCASHRCFVVVCKFGLPPKSPFQGATLFAREPNRPRLYVEYCSRSPSQDRYWIAKYSTITRDHLLSRVFQSQGYEEGVDLIPFNSGTAWSVDCEGIYYKGKVYAVFNLTPPDKASPDQLVLF